MEERNQPSSLELDSIRDKMLLLDNEISNWCRQLVKISTVMFNLEEKIQAIHQYLWNTDPEFRKLCVIIKKD